ATQILGNVIDANDCLLATKAHQYGVLLFRCGQSFESFELVWPDQSDPFTAPERIECHPCRGSPDKRRVQCRNFLGAELSRLTRLLCRFFVLACPPRVPSTFNNCKIFTGACNHVEIRPPSGNLRYSTWHVRVVDHVCDETIDGSTTDLDNARS